MMLATLAGVATEACVDVDREALADVCLRYGVAKLWIFGSVARGEAQPDSDVDLLYELAPNARLGWEILDLIDELQGLFGRPVDLISRRSVHPLVREAVLSEARSLHAA